MTLQPGDVTLKVPSEQLSAIAKSLCEYYSEEFGDDLPEWVLIDALSLWLEHRFEAITEDLTSVLSSPSRSEAREFRRFLEESIGSVQIIEESIEINAPDQEGVFTGYRMFSVEKLAAMAIYIAGRGKDLYKTKLNKLLFYSDFIHYYLKGTSISGAKYVHLPYGPVPDRYESVIRNLELAGSIKVTKSRGNEMVTASDDSLTERLSSAERSTIDWVLENHGSMSASEISDYSHREKAYQFTKTGEAIAYEYAKFFQKLPPTRSH